MQLSYRWLKRYCDFDLPPEAVAELLTNAGLEVEGIATVGSDTVLTVEVTTNRPDWLSHIGVAREVAALTGRNFRMPEINLRESGPDASSLTHVEVLDPDLCPRYTARVITGVKVAPSPDWLVEALRSVGLRSVNNVVDVTNFVLLESGQPLHAFDLDTLTGKRVVVRRARPGERITSIDGSRVDLKPEMLVIADAANPVAVAGVMGGLASEVSDRTTAVLLESARFNPVNVRRTSRALSLASDSSYRFERGIDPLACEWASRRAAGLIAELTGGKVLPGMVDVAADAFKPHAVSLRVSRFQRIMGVPIEPARAREILVALGLEPLDDSPVRPSFRIPSWRADLTREIDLVEEIARVHGLDKVPENPRLPLAMGHTDRQALIRDRVTSVLNAAGFCEAITLSLQDQDSCLAFHPFNDGAASGLVNPLNPDVQYLRVSLLPALLRARKVNEDRRNQSVHLWEIASVFLPADCPDELPHEVQTLGLLSDGDFASVKGVIESLVTTLRLGAELTFQAGAPDFLDPVRSARLLLDGQVAGYLGVVGDTALARFDLKTPVVAAEIKLHLLDHLASLETTYTPLPRFPEVTRDLAVVLEESVTWDAVRSLVRVSAPPTLRQVRFLSEFRGKQIPPGQKSLALGMVFRADDRTLTSDEVDAAQSTVLEALKKRFSAVLRGV